MASKLQKMMKMDALTTNCSVMMVVQADGHTSVLNPGQKGGGLHGKECNHDNICRKQPIELMGFMSSQKVSRNCRNFYTKVEGLSYS